MKVDHRINNLILQKITGLSKEQLFLSSYQLSFLEEKEFQRLIEKYKSWEPIEYILEKAEFYGLDFFVDSRVLVPRNDTEVMVDEVLKINWKFTLIDVWTWSSCIPISILTNNKNIDKCYVIDISKKALEVSKLNIDKYWLADKIEQIHGDLLENIGQSHRVVLKENVEVNLCVYPNIIITANLPYVKNWDFENMSDETVKFEPDLALYGWENTGFELYERLINQILELNKNISNIILFIEIWFDQRELVGKFLEKLNLKYEFFKDNWGINRCVKVYF